MMENFRLFIGIACPPDVSRAVAGTMDLLAAELAFRKWTHPDDLHVTIHFLGDTPAERLDAIRDVLQETASQAAPPVLSLTEPGTFGPPNAPRILWLGLAEPGSPGRLAQLHQALRPGLSAAGCQLEDRPFRAHMTIARQGGSGCGPEAVMQAWPSVKAAVRLSSESLQWTAGGITLFLTHPGRKPSYEKLREFPFGRK